MIRSKKLCLLNNMENLIFFHVFCKMASKRDFDIFLAPFWMNFGFILEASGNILVTFWVSFFKACFLMDSGAPQLLWPGSGESQ